MRTVKDKGKEELESFFNRVTRSYGKNRISTEDFNELHDLTKELMDKVDEIEEEDENE